MEDSLQPNTPAKLKPRRWLKIIGIIVSVIALIIFVVLAAFYFFVTDISKSSGSNFGVLSRIYENKCIKAGRVFEKVGWSNIFCYKKSSEAGKVCIQNSDCRGGACRPSAIIMFDRNYVMGQRNWTHAPIVNNEGFVTGTCSDAEYYEGGVIPPLVGDAAFCGYSIASPTKVEGQYGIHELFCD